MGFSSLNIDISSFELGNEGLSTSAKTTLLESRAIMNSVGLFKIVSLNGRVTRGIFFNQCVSTYLLISILRLSMPRLIIYKAFLDMAYRVQDGKPFLHLLL